MISIHALREEGDGGLAGDHHPLRNFYPRPPRGGRRGYFSKKQNYRYFYPRPPRGGRHTLQPDGYRLPAVFLSTPSARRATHGLQAGDVQVEISIHALREEGDHAPGLHCPGSRYFYPRPPRGGRQSGRCRFVKLARFLSTPSARRATGWLSVRSSITRISIHALREEGDNFFDVALILYPISIHALREEGDLHTHVRSVVPRDFYPRPPRGGRQKAHETNDI